MSKNLKRPNFELCCLGFCFSNLSSTLKSFGQGSGLSQNQSSLKMVCQLRTEIIQFYPQSTKEAQREWSKEWETVGRKRHDRTMPAYDNYTSTGQLHPYTAVIRTIPGAADPVCLAAQLDSTQLESTWCGSTVTDESLSVLSPDWHTRGAYHRTKAGTVSWVSPCHDFLSLKYNWWVNWIFMPGHRCTNSFTQIYWRKYVYEGISFIWLTLYLLELSRTSSVS